MMLVLETYHVRAFIMNFSRKQFQMGLFNCNSLIFNICCLAHLHFGMEGC